jgi:hypothetical protein
MKIDTFTNLMVANAAHKALQMKFLVERLKNLAVYLATTLRAHLCKELVEVFVAIRLVIVLMELIPFKWLTTFRTHEMVRMPRLPKCGNVLSFDNFATVSTPGIEFSVVVIFTIKLIILLNEGFATQSNRARYTPEAVRVKRFVLSNNKG